MLTDPWFYMVALPDVGFNTTKITFILYHKEFGVLAFVLLVARLGWRVTQIFLPYRFSPRFVPLKHTGIASCPTPWFSLTQSKRLRRDRHLVGLRRARRFSSGDWNPGRGSTPWRRRLVACGRVFRAFEPLSSGPTMTGEMAGWGLRQFLILL